MERGPVRPPRTRRRPLRLPLPLAIGARPTSLAMALLEKMPISGSSESVACYRARGDAFERRGMTGEAVPKNIVINQRGDLALELTLLALEQRR